MTLLRHRPSGSFRLRLAGLLGHVPGVIRTKKEKNEKKSKKKKGGMDVRQLMVFPDEQVLSSLSPDSGFLMGAVKDL